MLDRDWFDERLRQMFNDSGLFGRTMPEMRLWAGREFPAVETRIEDDKMVLRAELPGVDPDDVEVKVVGDRLELTGEKKMEREEQAEDRPRLRECYYGKFHRSFPLPDSCDADEIEAHWKNGVLEVVVPGAGKLAARRIPIQALPSGGKKKIA